VDQGKYDEGLQAFRTARSMDQRFYDEHFGISYQIGWVLNKLGRYEEALLEFENAEKFNPEWIKPYAIYYNEGVLLAKLGRNEEAIQAFDNAQKYDYWNWQIWFNKGCVFARMGRYKDAVTAFDNSRFSDVFFLLGSFQDASATYNKVQGIDRPSISTLTETPTLAVGSISITSTTFDQETSVDLLMAKGDDYFIRRQYGDAISVYDRILGIDPGNYHALQSKGRALAKLGRYNESLLYLNQALTYIDWRVDEGSYTYNYFVKGWVLAQTGDYDGAINAFDKVILVDPDALTTHYNKAWVLAKQNKYSEAVIEYNRSLDWENLVRLEDKALSLLGPLGTFQDAAETYNRASGIRSSVTQPSLVNQTLLYQTDFSSDPRWSTSSPKLFYWEQLNGTYHFKSDENLGYAEIGIPYNGTSFRFEYDITITHADPGSFIRIGLSQYNKTYNSQNTILTEFKSWRAGEYRDLKDGSKSFMVLTIDDMKKASDPEFEGLCTINREEEKSKPTFGNGRIYHVVIIFNSDKQVISYQVSDNLHLSTDFQCAWMNKETGIFRGMNRLILVADQGENAYIEGSIDNVELYQIESTSSQHAAARQGSFLPTTIVVPITTEQMRNQTTLLLFSHQVSNQGLLDNPSIIWMGILVGCLLSGFGIYVACKLREKSTKYYLDQPTILQKKGIETVSGTTSLALKETESPSLLSLKPVTPKQPPTELSEHYTDWEFIGKGGFARVFKAKRKDGQIVAVKIPISLDESTGTTFIAELQNWTRLNHPNIVKVYNFNIIPSPYFEMEICDSSLDDKKKPIDSEEAAWIIFNVCEGLKFAHSNKIIHRDLKPQNILFKDGVPKISDWGLSRVITESTSITSTPFTPNYAAPEQIDKKIIDERTDIWQLGVIFYELVTGTLPFTGDSIIEIMAGIATKNPQQPSVINPSSNDIEAMIMKCLEKKPDRRYQSVLELQKDLALYLRATYAELLKESVSIQDYNRSAYYCGDLIMVNLLTGDMKSAHKYLLDLVQYSKGDVKMEVQELSEQIKLRMEMGIREIPDELITKAGILIHKVSFRFHNMR
jgi:serine/threonine protein kinase/tetratricopeptide (TPR) repeat protein